MPRFLEKKLKQEYGEKSAIPYKIMNSIGVMRGNKETEKGAEMEAKHKRDIEMKKYSGSASSYKHSRPVRKTVRRSFGNG